LDLGLGSKDLRIGIGFWNFEKKSGFGSKWGGLCKIQTLHIFERDEKTQPLNYYGAWNKYVHI